MNTTAADDAQSAHVSDEDLTYAAARRAKAQAFLVAHPGEEFTRTQVAEALGTDVVRDVNGFGSELAEMADNGLIDMRRDGTRKLYRAKGTPALGAPAARGNGALVLGGAARPKIAARGIKPHATTDADKFIELVVGGTMVVVERTPDTLVVITRNPDNGCLRLVIGDAAPGASRPARGS